jgi:hypothetical protein
MNEEKFEKNVEELSCICLISSILIAYRSWNGNIGRQVDLVVERKNTPGCFLVKFIYELSELLDILLNLIVGTEFSLFAESEVSPILLQVFFYGKLTTSISGGSIGFYCTMGAKNIFMTIIGLVGYNCWWIAFYILFDSKFHGEKSISFFLLFLSTTVFFCLGFITSFICVILYRCKPHLFTSEPEEETENVDAKKGQIQTSGADNNNNNNNNQPQISTKQPPTASLPPSTIQSDKLPDYSPPYSDNLLYQSESQSFPGSEV